MFTVIEDVYLSNRKGDANRLAAAFIVLLTESPRSLVSLCCCSATCLSGEVKVLPRLTLDSGELIFLVSTRG